MNRLLLNLALINFAALARDIFGQFWRQSVQRPVTAGFGPKWCFFCVNSLCRSNPHTSAVHTGEFALWFSFVSLITGSVACRTTVCAQATRNRVYGCSEFTDHDEIWRWRPVASFTINFALMIRHPETAHFTKFREHRLRIRSSLARFLINFLGLWNIS